jgi:hypothetical protein
MNKAEYSWENRQLKIKKARNGNMFLVLAANAFPKEKI